MKKVFLSHAYADKPLLDNFVSNVLRLGLGAAQQQIFYSSDVVYGVPSGEDLSAFVRQEVGEGSLVVAFITSNFLKSPFCVAELGAAWASSGRLFPFLDPELDRSELEGILKGIAIRSFAEVDALDEFHDRVTRHLEIPPSAGNWRNYRDAWLRDCGALAASVRGGGARTRLVERGVVAWGGVFDSFVDASLCINDMDVARQEIERHIRAGHLIPSRYHYSSDSGADNWLHLCKEPTYAYHRNTTEFWAGAGGRQLVESIFEGIKGDDVDFVSLGPGDGEKDLSIIRSWLGSGADVMYYPYEISIPLAARAVKNVNSGTSGLEGGRLGTKAVLADFQHFSVMRKVFEYRPAPNVIALLGSLGNLHGELPFLRGLRQYMSLEDRLVLEVRLNSKAPELFTQSSLEHDFGPLEYYLHMEYDSTCMEVKRRRNVSTIRKGTETVAVSFIPPAVLGRKKKIKLQYVHLYKADTFLKAVCGEGFQLVDRHVDEEGAFLVCVLRKDPEF